MDQREQLIDYVQRGRMPLLQLCAHYGVSRETGYKWIVLTREEGRQGLNGRSHAPHLCPHNMSAKLADLRCALRVKHHDWGAQTAPRPGAPASASRDAHDRRDRPTAFASAPLTA